MGTSTLARQRLARLAEVDRQAFNLDQLEQSELEQGDLQVPEKLSRIDRLLMQSGIALSKSLLLIIVISSGFAGGFIGSLFLASPLVPLCIFAAMGVPFLYLDRLREGRAAEFSADYPAVLLACASSIKAGMTTLAGLERAVGLLPPKSLVRLEVEELIKLLAKGVPRQVAVSRFARAIDLPELELFRSAFLLALENGGRFAPTLERLARVCRDRSNLTQAARVSTATMRMTAAVLLGVAPMIVLLIAVRTADFWQIILRHPTANLLASVGFSVILGSVVVLYRMSRFKP